jgi:hypothetical protein
MLSKSIPLMLCLLLLLQQPEAPSLRRVDVATPYSASVVFEYAYALVPEDQPVTRKDLDELVAQLMSTGLFSDVKATTKPLAQKGKVDLFVTPTWLPARDVFVINRIVIEGETGLDDAVLRDYLGRHEIAPGMPLLKHPLPYVKRQLREAAREAFSGDPHRALDVVSKLQDPLVDIRIRPAAAGSFDLLINVRPDVDQDL